MIDIIKRFAYKTTGFKSLFVIAVLTVLLLHDFSPVNGDVLMRLIEFVLGAKAVQYAAQAIKEMKGKD